MCLIFGTFAVDGAIMLPKEFRMAGMELFCYVATNGTMKLLQLV